MEPSALFQPWAAAAAAELELLIPRTSWGLGDGGGDGDLDGVAAVVLVVVGSLEVAGLVGMMMMMNRGEMPRMLCD